MTGDSLLSPNDLTLWRLVQHVLITWRTLIVVKSYPCDVRSQTPGLVTFFVPRDATFRDEIVAFLEREAPQFETREYAARPDVGWPRLPPTHAKVEVMTFSGLLPYIPTEKSDAILREFATIAMQRLKGTLSEYRREDLQKAGPDPWWGVFGVAVDDPIAIFKDEAQADTWAEGRSGNLFFVRPVKNPVARQV